MYMDIIICLILSTIIIGFIVNANLMKKDSTTDKPIGKSKGKFQSMFDLRKVINKFKNKM